MRRVCFGRASAALICCTAICGCGGESGGIPSGVNGTLIQGVLRGPVRFGYNSNPANTDTELDPRVNEMTVEFEGADYEGNEIDVDVTPVVPQPIAGTNPVQYTVPTSIGTAHPTWKTVAQYHSGGSVCGEDTKGCANRYWADLSVNKLLRNAYATDTMQDYEHVEPNKTFAQIKSTLQYGPDLNGKPGPILDGYLYETGKTALLRAGGNFDTIILCNHVEGKHVTGIQTVTCQSGVSPAGIITINSVFSNSYSGYNNTPDAPRAQKLLERAREMQRLGGLGE